MDFLSENRVYPLNTNSMLSSSPSFLHASFLHDETSHVPLSILLGPKQVKKKKKEKKSS
jgi:hypothetical protein